MLGLTSFACSDGAVDPPEAEVPRPLVFPPTPDSVIRALQGAWELRDAASVDSLLAPGFLFRFHQAEVDSFERPPQWGKAEEIEAVRRLADGSPGLWADGTTHPPVNDFPFQTTILPVEGSSWLPDAERGTLVRAHHVSLFITLVDFNVHFVGGTNRFEVVDMSSIGGPDGEDATGYAILRWEDLGFSEGAAQPVAGEQRSLAREQRHISTWGFIKAVFGS